MEGRKKRLPDWYYDPESGKFVKKTKYYKMKSTTQRLHDSSPDVSENDEARSFDTEGVDEVGVTEERFSLDDLVSEENVSDNQDSDSEVLTDSMIEVEDHVVQDEVEQPRQEDRLGDGEYDDEVEVRPFWLYSDDEDVYSDDDDEPLETDAGENEEQRTGFTFLELRNAIGSWLIDDKTPQRKSRKLLCILRGADPRSNIFSSLPNDPRTLYPKIASMENITFKKMDSGEYAYLGVQHNLNLHEMFYDSSRDDLELVINIDGVPLFRTSPMKFWPILGSVHRRSIFIIALYKGISDPQCARTYLKDFFDEILPYFADGIYFNGKKYSFHLRCILADSPARAFLLALKRPTGYFSCSKCTVEGVYCQHRVCFPLIKDKNVTPRVPGPDFYKGTNLEGEECPLNRFPIEYFNIVHDVILDSMHLIYLGVFKKLIETILFGVVLKTEPSANTKRVISQNHFTVINGRLSELTEYYPCEFQRAPRSLKHLSYWRAHEFRQFLLYTWYTVLHDILPGNNRVLFRLLHVFSRILADPSKVSDRATIDYTINLAELFIALSCETFGDQWAIYNVHSLVHVPEDVFKFGCLDHDSCFKFEGFLYTLKRLVRSGRHPLKQALNRWHQWTAVRTVESDKREKTGFTHSDLSPGFEQFNKFKRYTITDFILRSDRRGDSCCMLNGDIIEISFFGRLKTDPTQTFLAGRKYHSSRPLFEDPLSSYDVGVFKCTRPTEEIQFFPVTSEENIRKMYRTPLFSEKDTFVCSILLHQTSEN